MSGDVAYAWLIVVLIGALTFLIRFSGIQLLGDKPLPGPLQRLLRYAPAAVFAAIVVPAVIHGGPDPGVHLGNTRLLAAIAAGITAWLSGSVFATLGVGMGVLWLLEALM